MCSPTPQPLYQRAYVENVTVNLGMPSKGLPQHLPKTLPVHKVVKVDVFLPGCPPSADLIFDTARRASRRTSAGRRNSCAVRPMTCPATE